MEEVVGAWLKADLFTRDAYRLGTEGLHSLGSSTLGEHFYREEPAERIAWEANQTTLMPLLKAKLCVTSGSLRPFPTQSPGRSEDWMQTFSRSSAQPHGDVRMLHTALN